MTTTIRNDPRPMPPGALHGTPQVEFDELYARVTEHVGMKEQLHELNLAAAEGAPYHLIGAAKAAIWAAWSAQPGIQSTEIELTTRPMDIDASTAGNSTLQIGDADDKRQRPWLRRLRWPVARTRRWSRAAFALMAVLVMVVLGVFVVLQLAGGEADPSVASIGERLGCASVRPVQAPRFATDSGSCAVATTTYSIAVFADNGDRDKFVASASEPLAVGDRFVVDANDAVTTRRVAAWLDIPVR